MQNISTKDLEVVTGGARSRTTAGLTDQQTLLYQQLQTQLTNATQNNQNNQNQWLPIVAIALANQKKGATVAAGPGFYSYSA